MDENPWTEFRIFIGIGILMWIAWFITGGPSRYEHNKPYVERPIGPGDVKPLEGPSYVPDYLISPN